jgi:hypothetical protein
MLVSEWQTTAAWMGQTWDENKAILMANHRIALMSVNNYHVAHYTYVMPQ